MPATPTLRHTIGFRAATCVVVGSIIGSGIFMKPATMALQVGWPHWLALVWVIAGIFSLFGALIFAEIGAMLPQTGGIYVYFRFMFGDFVAFLYGWAAFAVINTASVSAISFVCAQYADYFLQLPRLPAATEQSWVIHIPYLGSLYPLQQLGVKALAIVLVLGLTLLNYLSLKASSALQVLSTFVKVAVIGILVFGIFCSGRGDAANFITPGAHAKEGWSLMGGIITALTGAFMAYDGWINVTFIAGEIRSPQRIIPPQPGYRTFCLYSGIPAGEPGLFVCTSYRCHGRRSAGGGRCDCHSVGRYGQRHYSGSYRDLYFWCGERQYHGHIKGHLRHG